MEFKFFKGENIDKQKEKHDAYINAGYELFRQVKYDNGVVKRVYSNNGRLKATGTVIEE